MWGVGISLAVAIGDDLAGGSVSSIRPSGQVIVAAALAAERPPARIDRTNTTQDARLGLAHPNNSNSQLPIPNYQPLPNSNSQLPITLNLGIGSWALGVVGRWELGVGSLQEDS